MPSALDFHAVAARRLANLPDDWLPYIWESVPGGVLLRGKIPAGFVTRGPRKGRPKWGPDDGKHVFVSDEASRSARIEYEVQTGHCSTCADGLQWCGWSKESGHRYRDCRMCEGTGLTRKELEGSWHGAPDGCPICRAWKST